MIGFHENRANVLEIDGDTIWIEGFVRGDIRARTRIVLSRTARVIGNLEGPFIEIQPGAYFEGRCDVMTNDRSSLAAIRNSPIRTSTAFTPLPPHWSAA